MNVPSPLQSSSTPPASSPRHEDPKLEEALSQFEALFVGMLLKEVLRGEDGEGLMGKGPGSTVLGGLVQDTLAREVSQSGALEIGEQLRQVLHRQGEDQ